jgi:hypothetical protein
VCSNLGKSASQVSQIKTDSGPIHVALGNTGLLSLDPGEDKTPLYRQLLGTYAWHEKVRVTGILGGVVLE